MLCSAQSREELLIHGKRVIVVLPAYNAERTLEATLEEIPRDVVDEILLVDDASSDGTASLSERLGLPTIVHPENRGYGGNQKTCYEEALSRGADVVVMVHPDYQYDPRLAPAMASLVAQNVYDVVLGSRILGQGAIAGGMPRYKFVANRDSHADAEPAHRSEALGVPHRLPGILARRAREAAARRQLRRLRVRQPDAGAGALLRVPDRRGLVPDALRDRQLVDQLQAVLPLRAGRARDQRPLPPGEDGVGRDRRSSIAPVRDWSRVTRPGARPR